MFLDEDDVRAIKRYANFSSHCINRRVAVMQIWPGGPVGNGRVPWHRQGMAIDIKFAASESTFDRIVGSATISHGSDQGGCGTRLGNLSY